MKEDAKSEKDTSIADVENDDIQSDKFPLYTEKIVINPFIKYRKIFGFFKLIGAAVIFGTIAAFVMSAIYPLIQEKNDEQGFKRPSIVLDKDEYPYETVYESQNTLEEATNFTQTGTDRQLESLGMSELVEKAKKSVIGVDREYTSADNALAAEDNPTRTAGLIIGETFDDYIAVTNCEIVEGISECVVRLGESTECYADVTGVHSDLELAVLAIKKRNVPETVKQELEIAVLDNSYMLKQGEAVVAYGKLNGKNDVSVHSYITGIAQRSITDGVYDAIEISIPAVAGDYCFLFNAHGNVVGISRQLDEAGNMTVAGISDMKTMIEILTSGSEIVYFGITGISINNAIATKYGFPQGIYISDVVMDSPAYNAGLQAGDIITAFNGNSVLTIQAFSEKLYKCVSGQTVSVDIKRLGNEEYRSLNYSVILSDK